MVSQDHDLFAASILENILYGDQDVVDSEQQEFLSTKNSINDAEYRPDFFAPLSIEELIASKAEQVNSVLTALAAGDPLPSDCVAVSLFFVVVPVVHQNMNVNTNTNTNDTNDNDTNCHRDHHYIKVHN